MMQVVPETRTATWFQRKVAMWLMKRGWMCVEPMLADCYVRTPSGWSIATWPPGQKPPRLDWDCSPEDDWDEHAEPYRYRNADNEGGAW